MPRIVYLHMGLPKTGTSAIQEFCVDYREELQEEYNLFYPPPTSYTDAKKAGCETPENPIAGFWLQSLHLQLFYPGPWEDFLWENLSKKISRHTGKNILLSSEMTVEFKWAHRVGGR